MVLALVLQNSWTVHPTDHFDIYYRSPQDAAVVDRMAIDAERAYARVSFDLGRELVEKTPVIVARSPDDQASIVEAVGRSGSPERRLLVRWAASATPIESGATRFSTSLRPSTA
jgi:hypothetical protein